MKRAVFINPVIDCNDAYGIPAGLAALAGVLKESGWWCDIVPLYDRNDLANLSGVVAGVEFVGIYLVYSQTPYLSAVVEAIRAGTRGFVIAGGPHSTLCPESVEPFVDGVVRGEADLDICAIAEGILPKGVAPKPVDLEKLPFPHRPPKRVDEILKRTGGVLRFIFTRGCPHSCSYCCNHALRKLYGEPYVRWRSPDQAVQEIAGELAEHPEIKGVYFDDDQLNLDREWFRDFLGLYSHLELPFTANMRPGSTREDDFALLKKSGCTGVGMGVESGSNRVRKSLRRNISNEKIVESFKEAKAAGLKVATLNMIGLPGEMKEDFELTIDINRSIKPDAAYLYTFVPYPGSDAYARCSADGMLGAAPHGDERRGFNLDSAGMSRAEVEEFLRTFQKRIRD